VRIRHQHAQERRETARMLGQGLLQLAAELQAAERIEQLCGTSSSAWMRPANSACSWPPPQSTIDSTIRPASWFCTAAIVRRIFAEQHLRLGRIAAQTRGSHEDYAAVVDHGQIGFVREQIDQQPQFPLPRGLHERQQFRRAHARNTNRFGFKPAFSHVW